MRGTNMRELWRRVETCAASRPEGSPAAGASSRALALAGIERSSSFDSLDLGPSVDMWQAEWLEPMGGNGANGLAREQGHAHDGPAVNIGGRRAERLEPMAAAMAG